MLFQMNTKEFFSTPCGDMVFKSGQAVGLICPSLLVEYFPNLVLSKQDKVVGVMDTMTGKKYKVFYSPNGKWDTKPSFAKGCGRENTVVSKHVWDGWDGFMLVKNAELHKVLEVEIVEEK